MKWATERWFRIGFWRRLFGTAEVQAVEALSAQKQQALRRLLHSSPEHRAALRQIVNAIPPDNGGREALEVYL